MPESAEENSEARAQLANLPMAILRSLDVLLSGIRNSDSQMFDCMLHISAQLSVHAICSMRDPLPDKRHPLHEAIMCPGGNASKSVSHPSHRAGLIFGSSTRRAERADCGNSICQLKSRSGRRQAQVLESIPDDRGSGFTSSVSCFAAG